MVWRSSGLPYKMSSKLSLFFKLKQFLRILTKKEKVYFLGFFLLTFFSLFFLITNVYYENTEIIPAEGEIYIEGIVGQPQLINPVYATSNDVDRDLTELLFSGLMKYNHQGQIVPDLAKDYPNIEDGGKSYTFYLKENLFWSDGEKITADDIIFTIKLIQNPDYKSNLRTNWLGVEVEKISDIALRFKLEKPYAPFLERLTLKIIPYHIWKDIPAESFSKNLYNLQPVSCGPYKIKELKETEENVKNGIATTSFIESITLQSDNNYFDQKPYIAEIIFYFFKNEQDLIQAARQGKIKGFSLSSYEKNQEFKNYFSQYRLTIPRYFAVFFNPETNKIFSDKNIRRALNYATNKQEIIDGILMGQAKKIDSPVLSEIFNFTQPTETYQYDLEKAKELLEKAGFEETESDFREKTVDKTPSFQFKSQLTVGSESKEVEELQKCLANADLVGSEIYPDGEISGYFGTKTKEAVIRFQEKYKEEILEPSGLKKGTGTVGASTRKKLNQICFEQSQETFQLKFSLTTVDDPVLKKVADLLKEQWQKIGLELEIKTYIPSDLSYQEILKARNYDSLLIGEVLGILPDPYPFWHSLQKIDPGLNFAIYENKDVDKLLEEARQNQDEEIRKEKLEKFQDLLIKDAPVIFLYSPDYNYFISKEIKGIEEGLIAEPSKRFSEIENWYIKTKRVFK